MGNELFFLFLIYFSTEYFLIDWLYKRGNFSRDYLYSNGQVEGFFDMYNFDAASLIKNYQTYAVNRNSCMVKVGDLHRWEFAFSPNFGFLGSPDELITNSELKLSFDRANPNVSVLRMSGDTELEKPFKLKDVYAVTEYVSSPRLQEKFSMLDYKPFTYQFDDCSVLGRGSILGSIFND